MASPMSAGNRQNGFTYLSLLVSVAVTGAGLAAIGELTSSAAQREKEAELLFIGDQYRQAIASYYERSPGGAKRYPQKLEDMLQDARFPMPQRHLRRVWPDPVTGGDWGIIPAQQGGIMGVYSVSEAQPVKTGNFSLADQSFEAASRYAEWRFFYAPPTGQPVAGQPAANGEQKPVDKIGVRPQ
jgi:type II secretory pathway pseudopilin PulG